MLADGGAGEVHAVAFAIDTDEGKVRSAAAHIADQDMHAVAQLLLTLRKMIGDPGVERRGRLLNQGKVEEARLLRRGFNLGVELGQIAVILLAWPALSVAGRFATPVWRTRVRDLATVGLCSLGCFWLFQRAFVL